jgi:hypothetical protein
MSPQLGQAPEQKRLLQHRPQPMSQGRPKTDRRQVIITDDISNSPDGVEWPLTLCQALVGWAWAG